MPCNSDYMEPTTYERNLSRVACLLDELAQAWAASAREAALAKLTPYERKVLGL